MILAVALLALLGCSQKWPEVLEPIALGDFAKVVGAAVGCPPKPPPPRVPPEWEVSVPSPLIIARVALNEDEVNAWLSPPDEDALSVDREKCE